MSDEPVNVAGKSYMLEHLLRNAKKNLLQW